MITTLQSESREAIAFNSVSAYFKTSVLHFMEKKKEKENSVLVFTRNCSKHKLPLEIHYVE